MEQLIKINLESIFSLVALFAKNIIDTFLEIGFWMNEGPWYSVGLKVFGVIGVFLVIRSLYFSFCESEGDDSLITRLIQLIFYLTSLAIVLLFFAMIWIKFIR